TWYGTSDFPVKADSQTQYNTIVERINEGAVTTKIDLKVGDDVATSGEGVPTVKDQTYAPTVSHNYYTVTFKNEDGTVLQSGEVEYGTVPSYSGVAPTKAATAQYTYNYLGWDNAITAVTGNTTYTATYSSTVNSYTVTYYGYDKTTVLGTESVEYGNAATTYNTYAPAYDAVNARHVVFEKWVDGNDDDASFANVIADRSVYAKSYALDHKFTITFADHSGTAVQTQQVTVGDDPAAYSGSLLAKYTDSTGEYFYTGFPSLSPATEDRTYTANYTSLIGLTRNAINGNNGIWWEADQQAYGYKATIVSAKSTKWENRFAFDNTWIGGNNVLYDVANYSAIIMQVKFGEGFTPGNEFNTNNNFTKNNNVSSTITYYDAQNNPVEPSSLVAGEWYTAVADLGYVWKGKTHDVRLYFFNEGATGSMYIKNVRFGDYGDVGAFARSVVGNDVTYGATYGGKTDVVKISRSVALGYGFTFIGSHFIDKWNEKYNSGETYYMVFDYYPYANKSLYLTYKFTSALSTSGTFTPAYYINGTQVTSLSSAWYTVAVKLEYEMGQSAYENDLRSGLAFGVDSGNSGTFYIDDIQFVKESDLHSQVITRSVANANLANYVDPVLYGTESVSSVTYDSENACYIAALTGKNNYVSFVISYAYIKKAKDDGYTKVTFTAANNSGSGFAIDYVTRPAGTVNGKNAAAQPITLSEITDPFNGIKFRFYQHNGSSSYSSCTSLKITITLS
ncbi:MAG: hypothetical protein IJ800_04670, partial [Clostridia bacterium]|nr:hypothetical protein [Clostridia bacterium]